MLSANPAKVRCRPIQECDLEETADLLAEGFPARSRKYWTNGFDSLRLRPTLEGFPRFGHVLESEGALVGVLLLILVDEGRNGALPRFNVSSWYVRPAFRVHAPMLVAQTLKRKQAIYLNTSPAPETLPILSALGFKPLTSGQYLSVPALTSRGWRAQAASVGPVSQVEGYPDPDELALLRDHAAQGCLSFALRDAAGWAPMVFLRRRVRFSPLPVAQLAYCRETADLARFGGAVGSALAAQGYGLVLCDADGPVPGLVGRFFPGRSPKFYKGPVPPQVNDLSYTEAVVFGA